MKRQIKLATINCNPTIDGSTLEKLLAYAETAHNNILAEELIDMIVNNIQDDIAEAAESEDDIRNYYYQEFSEVISKYKTLIGSVMTEEFRFASGELEEPS